MGEIIDLNDYKRPEITTTCRVAFTWLNNPRDVTVRLTVIAKDGNYEQTVAFVRDDLKGLYYLDDRGFGEFYPWPPAHVEILPA